MDKKNNIIKNKRLRYGTYYAAMTCLTIGVLIVINLIMGRIDKSIDLTDQQLYSLSDESKLILSTVDEDITVYKLFKTESDEDIVVTINEILKNYSAVCPHIKSAERDPYIHPKFVEEYTRDSIIPVNSLIVEKGKRFKVIEPSKFYSKSLLTGEDVLDIESQITNAIIFVSLEKTPTIYHIIGHEEEDVPENLKAKLEYSGYEIKDADLTRYEKIPDECDFIMITTAKRDYSDHETEIINDFLAKDGRALFFMNFSTEKLPKLESIINAYGVETTNGIIRENDPKNYYAGDPDIIIPNVSDHESVKFFSDRNFSPRMKFPQPLNARDVKKTSLKLYSVLTTSNDSYSTDNDNRTSSEYSSEDRKGPFTVGYAVTDSTYTDEEHTTKLMVIGSSAFLEDGTDTSTGGFNSEFAVKCFDWLNDNSVGIYVSPKSIEVKDAEVNGSDAFAITLFTCGIVPFGILLTGFIVWLKRRNR